MKKTLAAAAALTLIITGCGSDPDPEAITDPPDGYHGEITEEEVVAGNCPDLNQNPYGLTGPHAEGFGYKVYLLPITASEGLSPATGGLLIQNWGNTEPQKILDIDVMWSNGETDSYSSEFTLNGGGVALCDYAVMPDMPFGEDWVGVVPTSVELELT